VECNPVHYRRGLLNLCLKQDVAVEAYSPLGTGLPDKTVRRIAEHAGRTPAQVLLRWCVQRGIPVIPKSTRRERIEQNAQIFDFALPDEDMAALDSVDTTKGTERALEQKWW
jgi:diketogulonate reductase-like aldo/keto reductase